VSSASAFWHASVVGECRNVHNAAETSEIRREQKHCKKITGVFHNVCLVKLKDVSGEAGSLRATFSSRVIMNAGKTGAPQSK